MSPHEPAADGLGVGDLLHAISRRLRAREALWTLATAVSLGAVVWTAFARSGLPGVFATVLVAVLCGGASIAWLRQRRSRWSGSAAARAIERAQPISLNLVITAEELLRYPDRARPRVRESVFQRSAAITSGMNPAAIAPLKNEALIAVAAVVFAVAIVAGLPQRATAVLQKAIDDIAPAAVRPAGDLTIEVTVTPPAYTGTPARTLRNPDRIDALQGSRLHLTLDRGGPWRVRFGSEPLAVLDTGDRSDVELVLQASGYLAIEAEAGDAASRRRLVPIAVVPDRAPTIRIGVPAKDLLMPDAKPSIGIEASATDDFGLQSLELRYTKVSGTGEQFEFQEGTIPLGISRQNERAWSGRAQLALPKLGLAPGDSLIYRVVGRDRRPGDEGFASSDTYFVEIAGPGQVALEGFEMPPDRERYALSQQMIVLKLERLRTRERSLARAPLEEEIAGIAAEQRAVRANFVFLMGGHVEDEEEEAEHSHEIQEGRLENSARREIATAIQHMSRAEQGMAAVSTGAALPPARAAVHALQRAFGRNRYFLRTVPVRSRVDASRRLSGDKSSATDWRRELFPVRASGPVAAARRILAALLELSPEIRSGAVPAAALTAFAEEAVAVDPASPHWQSISNGLLKLRDSSNVSSADRSALLNRIVGEIAAVIRPGALSPRPFERDNSLRSAWAEVRRR